VAARVLVLDDNLELAENVRDVLERGVRLHESYADLRSDAPQGRVEVVVAHDAKTGLKLAAERAFDVAIVDVRLPDGSGVDLIAPLRASMPHGEVVLLTGNATVESAINALRAGAAGFVLKSFRPEELIATVELALEKGRLRREREKYERRYDALMNATEVLIVGLDVRGSVVFFNAKTAALLGVSEAEVSGRSFVGEWVEAADRNRFLLALADAIEGETTREFEIGLVAEGGAPRRVLWHLTGVGEERPEVFDHVYGIGVDVTERRALERRAANAEALNAMAPLALGLAHEIRNPLNAAVLELHLLGRAIGRIEDASVQPAMQRRVEIVVSEIRRLERLLTEFLELARPRAPQREPVELYRVVSDVLDLEAEAMARSNVLLERDLEPGASVLVDVEKLKQVVLNLVVNALDAMPEGGRLTARVFADETHAVLSLTDTGKGVDAKILSDVFDPFFTTKPAGTGLGLAIVRKLTEQHGGTVALSPAAGQGTTATVRLPRVAPGS
jgi:PAS domain S-box-containing protein